MKPPKDYSDLFLDMNAFFASVEQQVQPKLRGRPVAVAPYTGATGCVIAKSYEAKAFGITTGTSVGEAQKLCPSLLVLEARPELYLFYHREIIKVLKSFSPYLEILSVDEFNFKLTGLDQERSQAIKMGKMIKREILEKIGDHLFCSVGIGPNRWLAKVAGELKKPDGLVAVTLKELAALYRTLDLLDLPGINIQMKKRLARVKIQTPFDFYKCSLFNLSRHFGHPGRMWFYRLRGFEIDEIKSAPKSIGHQHVLAPEFRTVAAGRRVLVKLAHKCGRRLRAQKMAAGGILVAIKFLHEGYFQKHQAADLISDDKSIERLALHLYDAVPAGKRPLRLSVTLFHLQLMRAGQISIFSEVEKSRNLSKTIDQINDKYGENAIFPASMFGTDEAAPRRIAFGDPGRE